ncbi:MAG: hypothetical protein KA053_02440 [Lentimicrobiaceae bacterium]|nr:hypothetical protein [Lentimicrobiaceae bacterium]
MHPSIYLSSARKDFYNKTLLKDPDGAGGIYSLTPAIDEFRDKANQVFITFVISRKRNWRIIASLDFDMNGNP